MYARRGRLSRVLPRIFGVRAAVSSAPMRRAAAMAVLAMVLAPQAAAATFPRKQRIAAVKRYLRHREGVNSFSVLNTTGHLHGWDQGRVYVSASVVKAMMLVAYLRKIHTRLPSPEERS